MSPSHTQRGFSLLEVFMAGAVTFVTLTGIALMMSRTSNISRDSTLLMQSSQLAVEAVEGMRGQGFYGLAASPATGVCTVAADANFAPGDARITGRNVGVVACDCATCNIVGGGPFLKCVMATVTWNVAGGQGSISSCGTVISPDAGG